MPVASRITGARHTVDVTLDESLPDEEGTVHVTYLPSKYKTAAQQQRVRTLFRAVTQMEERAAQIIDLDERNTFYDAQTALLEEESSGVVCAICVSWDMYEDAEQTQMVPLTRENLARFGEDCAVKILVAIVQDMNPSSARDRTSARATSIDSSSSGTSSNGRGSEILDLSPVGPPS